MCLYSTIEVAKIIGYSERAMYDKLREIKKKKKFKKKLTGYFYTKEDVYNIAKLLRIKVDI